MDHLPKTGPDREEAALPSDGTEAVQSRTASCLPIHRSKSTVAKRASSLDRVFLVLTADSSAVQPGPAASVAPAGSVGSRVFGPFRASADQRVVD